MENLAIKALGQIAKKQIPEFRKIVEGAEKKYGSKKNIPDESDRTSFSQRTQDYNLDKRYQK